MTSETILFIYKIISTLVWGLAIVGAIYYFARSIKQSYISADSGCGFIGRFYDKNDECYKLCKKNDDLKIGLWLVLVFFIVRILSVVIAFVIKGSFFEYYIGSVFTELGRWDAPHYIDIARNGYISKEAFVPESGYLAPDPWYFIVFYPLFPWLIKLVSFTGISFEAASFILPNIFVALSLPVLYKLLRIDFSKNVSVTAVLFMIFNPFAFFFSFPFTESLFLFLSVSLFYCIRKEKWLLAGVFGFFATLTKNFGLILVVPFGVYLIIVACKRRYSAKKFILDLLPVFLILAGFGVYLLINYIVYKNPFQFMIYQKEHWYNEISCIIENMQLHLSYILDPDYDIANKLYIWVGDVVATVFLLSAVFIKHKKIPFVYTIYTLAYIFLTLTVSWLLSGARYVLPCFTAYVPFALLCGEKKWIKYPVIAVEFVLGAIILTAYTLGCSIM